MLLQIAILLAQPRHPCSEHVRVEEEVPQETLAHHPSPNDNKTIKTGEDPLLQFQVIHADNHPRHQTNALFRREIGVQGVDNIDQGRDIIR